MAKAGRRYPLVIYTHMIDRWWPAVLLLGLALASLAWPLYQDPFLRLAQPWRWQTMAWLGGAVTVVSLIMAAFRKAGYVQPFSDHLQLVTPFLRMSISYRRILRTTTVSIGATFPPTKYFRLEARHHRTVSRHDRDKNRIEWIPVTSFRLKVFSLAVFLSGPHTPLHHSGQRLDGL